MDCRLNLVSFYSAGSLDPQAGNLGFKIVDCTTFPALDCTFGSDTKDIEEKTVYHPAHNGG